MWPSPGGLHGSIAEDTGEDVEDPEDHERHEHHLGLCHYTSVSGVWLWTKALESESSAEAEFQDDIPESPIHSMLCFSNTFDMSASTSVEQDVPLPKL